MPGPFHGIDIASRALRAFQRAMDVTGHNIANVNTAGYSRQAVDFGATQPLGFYSGGWHALGTGVSITSVNRVRLGFLDERMRDASADLSKFGATAAALRNVADIYGEPGESGISNALGKFFDSWSSLASNPNELANRTQVRSAAQTLTMRVRGAYGQMKDSMDQARIEATTTVNQINAIGEEIATLNNQIREANSMGGQPNDLLDQRDQKLEELSALVNIRTSMMADGTVTVAMSEHNLVDNVGVNKIPAVFDEANGKIVDGSASYQIRSGKLAGLMAGINQYKKSMTDLDTLANTLKSQINSVHQTGTNLNGTTNLNFFTDAVPQTGAINFEVSVDVTNDVRNISTGVTGNAGDNGLAISISQMRTASHAALGNRSFLQFHIDNNAVISNEYSYYNNAANTQELVSGQISAQRESVTGVNLDDEMSNMLRYQRSYQAAAKVLSTFDQMTQDLLDMLRR